jgi:hypothetical protein
MWLHALSWCVHSDWSNATISQSLCGFEPRSLMKPLASLGDDAIGVCAAPVVRSYGVMRNI